MSKYFERATLRIFSSFGYVPANGSLDLYQEDWDKKTVSFLLTGDKVVIDVSPLLLETIAATFGTSASFRFECTPDGRYANDPEYGNKIGVYLRVNIEDVTFPKPHE